MARYIDADALKSRFKGLGFGEHSLMERFFADGFYAVIDNAPTVNAVAVVRCKDCRWYGHKRACPLAASGLSADCIKLPKEDDFCSYGERRNDG